MLNNVIVINSLIEELISNSDFAEAAKQLLKDQKKSWKQLHEGYKSLKEIKIKTFQFDGFRMKLQFNP